MELKSYQVAVSWDEDGQGELRKWHIKPNAPVNKGEQLCSVFFSGRMCKISSPTNGVFEVAYRRESEMLKPGDLLGVINACRHEVHHGGICATCSRPVDIVASTQYAMLPKAQLGGVVVTNKIAEERHQKLVDVLLSERKLYLVLDLDLTVLQATVERSEVDTKRIEAYRKAGIDIKEFVLDQDTLHHKYFVKFRPGIKEFMNEISTLFDVHVYTLGARSYAEAISHLLDDFIDDPAKKLFRGARGYKRIMTRTESNELREKNLNNVLQNGDQIAIIVDDREDVWRYSIQNLLPAKPYDFFKGDIHDPKLLQAQAGNAPDEKSIVTKSDWISPAMQALVQEGKIAKPAGYDEKLQKQLDAQKANAGKGTKRNREESFGDEDEEADAPLAKYAKLHSEALSSSSAKDPAAVWSPQPSVPPHSPANTQTAPTGKVAFKVPLLGVPAGAPDMKSKLKSLPSLKKTLPQPVDPSPSSPALDNKMDDALSSLLPEDSSEKSQVSLPDENPSDNSESTILVKLASDEKEENEAAIPIPEDNDSVLHSIISALKRVHKLFYEEFDRTHNLPDVKKAIDNVRRDTFRNCNITFSHIIPHGSDPSKDFHWRRSVWFGANCQYDLNATITHLVCGRAGTDKLRSALKLQQPLYIMNKAWLMDSMDHFRRQDERKYGLIDEAVDPPLKLPIFVGKHAPVIGSPQEKRLAEVSEQEEKEASQASLAYSQSVSEGGTPLSSPRHQLEEDLADAMDIDEPVEESGGITGEKVGDDDGEVINFDDISSDLDDEEEEWQEERNKELAEVGTDDAGSGEMKEKNIETEIDVKALDVAFDLALNQDMEDEDEEASLQDEEDQEGYEHEMDYGDMGEENNFGDDD